MWRVDVLPFHVIAQHKTGIVVVSTVVTTSFTGVDSFDKMRFWFIAGHLPTSSWEISPNFYLLSPPSSVWEIAHVEA